MKWQTQFVRYGIIGVLNNAIGYFFFLWLVHIGLDPKTAMSLLYGIGVLQTFYFNRSWSFGHTGKISSSFAKYLSAYALGYLLNLLSLFLMVDYFGFSHEFVQAFMILFVAGMLFLLQRYWIFRAN